MLLSVERWSFHRTVTINLKVASIDETNDQKPGLGSSSQVESMQCGYSRWLTRLNYKKQSQRIMRYFQTSCGDIIWFLQDGWEYMHISNSVLLLLTRSLLAFSKKFIDLYPSSISIYTASLGYILPSAAGAITALVEALLICPSPHPQPRFQASPKFYHLESSP